jgi:hypothetical protein
MIMNNELENVWTKQLWSTATIPEFGTGGGGGCFRKTKKTVRTAIIPAEIRTRDLSIQSTSANDLTATFNALMQIWRQLSVNTCWYWRHKWETFLVNPKERSLFSDSIYWAIIKYKNIKIGLIQELRKTE